MIFDSHTHLNLAAFENDREKILQKYLKEGIFLINVGTCYETSLKAIQIANKYSNCWASVGIHPSHTFPFKNDPQEVNKTQSVLEENFNEKFLALLNEKRVVAIGECGLDFSYLKDFPLTKQKEYQQKEINVFIQQIRQAQEKKLPMIFHVRDLYIEALRILEQEKFNQGGVFHFFTGTLKEAKLIINKGYYIGFSGVITYSNKLNEVIKYLPLDRILIETDAPYVTPLPYRGKRNEPKYVIQIAQKIAEIKEITVEIVISQTFYNTCNLFNINN